MALSKELVSQFVKATKDDSPKKSESVVYGVIDAGGNVKIDGSDTAMPISDNQTTTVLGEGNRVTVMIKDHRAVVTGNLSDNAVTIKKVREEVDTLNSEYVKTKYLEANYATITSLDAEKLRVDDLLGKKATVEDLLVERGRINILESSYAKLGDVYATRIDVDTLLADKADIDILRSDYITANEIETIYVKAADAALEYAKINTIEANYAKINLSNVKVADIGDALIKVGLISDATFVNGQVTGFLDAVKINANNITAGTLNVDRLIISGSDKSIIYALNNSGNLVSAEMDTINGDIITEDTITADHIVAGAITADKLAASSVTTDKIATNAVTAGKISVSSLESIVAKIGSFDINKALYTNGHSAYNSAVSGVYVGSDYISLGNGGKTWLKADGSVSIGSNAIKYDAIVDSLDIVASSIKMGSERVITTNDIDKLHSGGENLLVGSKKLTGVVSNGSAAKVELDNGFTAFECVGNWKGVTFHANDIITKHKVFDEFTYGVNLRTSCVARLQFFALCYDKDGVRVYPEYASGQGNSHDVATTPDYEQDVRYSTTFSITQGWLDLINAGGNVWWSLQTSGEIPVETPVYIYAPKLERGNIASDWSPSSTDIDARFLTNESNINILEDAINATVGTTQDGWNKYTQMVQKYDSFTWSIDQTAIVATETQYALGDSSSTAPTSGWESSVTWTDGKYTWMRSRNQYANGTYSSWTTPVCTTGNTGADGKDATRTADTIIHKEYKTRTYWLIAKSTSTCNNSATYGYVRIWGTIGAYESSGNGHVDLNVGFRSTPSCILTQRDSSVNTAKCNIVGYKDSDDYVYVYAVLNGYANAMLFTEGTQYTVVNSTSTTAPTGTLIFDLSNMTAQNAQTATNYMNLSSNGLVIGNLTEDTLGKNILIDTDSVDIRSGTDVRASFGEDYLYLAKHSRNATIDLCNGLAKLYHASSTSYDTIFVIDTPNITKIRGTYNPLQVESTVSGKTAIQFANTSGVLGSIGMVESASGAMITRNVPSTASTYTVLDTGNYYTMMDSGWINCTLNTGTFSRYSNDIPQPQVRKIGKQVYLRGEAKPSKDVTPTNDLDTVIATIPSGYRPAERKQFIMQGSTSYRWLMGIHPDGTITISRYTNNTTTNQTISSGAWLCCHAEWLIE